MATEEGYGTEYRITSKDDDGDWYLFEDDLFFESLEVARAFVAKLRERYPNDFFGIESRVVTKWKEVV
jgi:hypothetical protein